MNESFIFYRSFAEAVKRVPKGQREELYEAIINYALNNEEYTGDNFIAKMVLDFVKPQIKANEERRINGSKGGRPKKNPTGDTDENPTGDTGKKPMVIENAETKKPMVIENAETKKPNVNDNVNVECINDNDNVDKEKDNTSIIPKEKKEHTAEFREALINFGVETEIADELMLIRKKKKAINTKHAFEMMLAEANKAGITLAEAVKICVDNQWKGFKAEYLQGLRERNSRGGGRGHTLEEMARIVDAGIALNDILGTRNETERRGETWNSTGR